MQVGYMAEMQGMSSRARVDELSYLFLNGKVGLSLSNRFGAQTPELKQFKNFVNGTSTINIGKEGMAPTFATPFAGDLQQKYSVVRDLTLKLDQPGQNKEVAGQLLTKVEEVIRLLDDFSLASQKSLLR